MFSVDGGKKSKLSDFEDAFYSAIEIYQKSEANEVSKLVPADCDIREEFGIWRSLRRGVTAHAINQGVPSDLINLINRWRSEKDKQAQHASMIDVYAELESLVPTTKKYSLAL